MNDMADAAKVGHDDVSRRVFAAGSKRQAGKSAFGPLFPPSPKQARKPYTITKQRERWSESEHALFLEALRLFGRQWRKIEGKLQEIGRDCHSRISLSFPALAEHIGTKNAVQIRSHAQKFFDKVERGKDGAAAEEEEGA